MFENSQAPKKVLVVPTDSNDTVSRMPPDRAVDIARQRDIKVHTVGIGDPSATGEDKFDVATVQKIAAATSSGRIRTSLSRFTRRSTG
jgi:Ca-activated chloride channel homolog